MKKSMPYLLIVLLTVFFMYGCSNQPLQEINAAKSAVDSVVSEGAEKYLPDDTRKINDDLLKAMDEVKAQDTKFFKNYARAKELLAAVRLEAEALNAKLPVKKEEAKTAAISAMGEARAAMDEANTLFQKAPRGNDPNGADETVSIELKNIEDSFQELQMQIEREDYLTIASRAAEIKSKASELSALIKQLPAKAEKKKK